MEAIRDEREKCQLESIYDVDETGLQWKLMPKRTYLSTHEDQKTARGTKYMHYKDRVSAFMYTNAPGTDKVDMTIIGKAKSPRCFKGRKCPLTFFSQAKTWADNVTYRKRWKQVFLRHIWRTPHRQELLLMDGCSSHEDLEDDRGKPKAMVYLPNCTSVRRPMDQGIIPSSCQP